jgi:hypothetical protein
MRRILLVAMLAACGGGGGDDDGDDIPATTLAGTVGGEPWTFVAGDTDAFLSEGEDDFFALLYAGPFTPCGFDAPSGNHLIVSVPKEPGEYPLSLSLNMTFVVGESDNLVATDGVIVVDEVTDTTIRGGLLASFDADNEVAGQFDLTICNVAAQ